MLTGNTKTSIKATGWQKGQTYAPKEQLYFVFGYNKLFEAVRSLCSPDMSIDDLKNPEFMKTIYKKGNDLLHRKKDHEQVHNIANGYVTGINLLESIIDTTRYQNELKEVITGVNDYLDRPLGWDRKAKQMV